MQDGADRGREATVSLEPLRERVLLEVVAVAAIRKLVARVHGQDVLTGIGQSRDEVPTDEAGGSGHDDHSWLSSARCSTPALMSMAPTASRKSDGTRLASVHKSSRRREISAPASVDWYRV